jgi:hypothetical protein
MQRKFDSRLIAILDTQEPRSPAGFKVDLEQSRMLQPLFDVATTFQRFVAILPQWGHFLTMPKGQFERFDGATPCLPSG